MSNPEPGWYDDPWSGEQYRYWDGQAWTHHAAPKHVAPSQAPPVPNPYTGPYAGQPYSGQPYSGQQGLGQQASEPQPSAGHQPHTGPYADTWRPSFGPTTPDGIPLSGWWRRVGARILDQLIVYAISLPFAGYFWFQAVGEFSDYFDRVMDAGNNDTSAVTIPADLQVHVLLASLITVVIAVGYEAVLLRRSGATWGKRAAGIRVRLRDVEGRLDWGTIARRIGFVQGLALLSLIPLIGIAAAIAGTLNYLWPLWDSKNQALHDKVAATNVVRDR